MVLSHVFGVEGNLAEVCTRSEERNISIIFEFNQMSAGILDTKWEFFHLIRTEVLFSQTVHKVLIVCLHERDIGVLKNAAELDGLENI